MGPSRGKWHELIGDPTPTPSSIASSPEAYVVEFRTAEGEALAIDPRSEASVIRHFQEQMPYGLFVPEVPTE